MCANNVTSHWPAVTNFDPTITQVHGFHIKSHAWNVTCTWSVAKV